MSNIFYFMVIIPLLYEFYNLFNAQEHVSRIKLIRSQKGKREAVLKEISEVDTSHEFAQEEIMKLRLKLDAIKDVDINRMNEDCFPTMLAFIYMIWTFLGLFTFQWPIFIVLFLLGFMFARLPKTIWLSRVDAVLSIGILVFILINAYHLHIDIWEILINSIIN